MYNDFGWWCRIMANVVFWGRAIFAGLYSLAGLWVSLSLVVRSKERLMRLSRENFINETVLSWIHSDSKGPILFVNWFWHLIVGNKSIGLNIYQQRPLLAFKIHLRPQRPKKPMKANKGQQSPKFQISLLLSLFNVK